MSFKAKPKAPTLDERIDAVHQDVDDLIARRVADLRRDFSSLPAGVLEMQVRRGQCRCEVAKRLLKGDA